MKISAQQLRKTIRKVLRESSGIDDYEKLTARRRSLKSAPSNDMSPNEMLADEYRRKNNLPATSLREMDNDFPESDLMVQLAEQLTYAMAVEMGLAGSDFKSRDRYFELMRIIFGIVGANTNGKI